MKPKPAVLAARFECREEIGARHALSRRDRKLSFAGGPSVTIKSHHNVGGLLNSRVNHHPFPGPGLAIWILGDITTEKLDLLRKVDAVYLDEIRKASRYDQIWQTFAVLLPVRTVGVMGDGRTYAEAGALRAVSSTDGMTGDYFPCEHAVLGRVANGFINEVRSINRVTYDITSKPPGTIEWE